VDRFAHYAWPFFEEKHRALARKAEAWGRNAFDFSIEPSSVDSFCKKLVASLGDARLLEHCVTATPDVRSIAILREVLAYHAGLADFALAMQGLGSAPIVLAGTEEQKKKWLPKVSKGEAIAAFALSEPEAGSDVQALQAKAVHEKSGWRLSGTKTWISNGGIADFYVVFARAPEGITAFLVNAKEVDASERIEIIAPHPMATLKLEGAKAELLGEEGQGFKLAMRTLDIFRTTVAGAALGFARRALDEALGRARGRSMFGRKLADLQMTQARLADMATGIESAALLAYKSAWKKDLTREKTTADAAMAKMHATEVAQQVVDGAVQLLGGLGVRSGHPVERLYREVRALRIYEGATEVQKVIIARELLR
jgi:acyl-CoA dehydrogenase